MSQALRCPRCNGAVSVSDESAGQRVKCPHCEQTFLAPGITTASNDDDDWLQLDSDPIPLDSLPDKPPASKTPSPTPATGGPVTGGTRPLPPSTPNDPVAPALSSDDQALLDEFTADLDDFTAEIEAIPPTTPAPAPASTSAEDPFDGLPAMATDALPPSGPPSTPPVTGMRPPAPAEVRPPAPAEVKPVEYAKEYRVKCLICGSILYAKAEQAGQSLTCSDCHSPVKVPPPPKVAVKHEIDLDQVETFSLEQTEVKERVDPFKKSADELLEEASREDDEEKKGPIYEDVPSVKEWATNVFGIFLDPGVLVHWLGLSFLASVPAVFVLSMDMPFLVFALFPGGVFLGALVACCGFAILQAVANEEERVTDWPVMDPMGWFGQLFIAVAAALVAAVPAWVVCQMVFGSTLLSVAITMFSVYAFFPFIILSMLDMNSVLQPFSAEVARSVTKCEEAWGGFYFSSGLLFAGLFLMFIIANNMPPAGAAVIAIFATIAIAFTYFSMIGRLAYSIGQAINAPPMKNDIDRDARSQQRDGSVA